MPRTDYTTFRPLPAMYRQHTSKQSQLCTVADHNKNSGKGVTKLILNTSRKIPYMKENTNKFQISC